MIFFSESSHDGRLFILFILSLVILSIPIFQKTITAFDVGDDIFYLTQENQHLALTSSNKEPQNSFISFEAAYPLFFKKIPINTASRELLETIPGIGPKISLLIIEKRNSSGIFKATDDLEQIDGLGPRKVHSISNYITFE